MGKVRLQSKGEAVGELRPHWEGEATGEDEAAGIEVRPLKGAKEVRPLGRGDGANSLTRCSSHLTDRDGETAIQTTNFPVTFDLKRFWSKSRCRHPPQLQSQRPQRSCLANEGARENQVSRVQASNETDPSSGTRHAVSR